MNVSLSEFPIFPKKGQCERFPLSRLFQLGVAVTVDQGVNLFPFLAVGTFVLVVGVVGGNILGGKEGVDRQVAVLGDGAEDGGDTYQLTAIEFDAFPALVDGDSGGDGCHQDDHVSVLDHGLYVFAEEHLAVGVNFGCDDIDRFMDRVGEEAFGSQHFCQESSDDFRSVQTDDGVDDNSIFI